MTALAEYRELEKRDFQASDLGVFGLFKRHRVLLTRRPVKRLFMLGLKKQQYIDLQIVTSADKHERAAVTAVIQYFNLFGREITVDGSLNYQEFFADPEEEAESQRLWFERPKGGLFAFVRLQRAVKDRRIGLDARFKLSPREKQAFSDEELLRSRDKKALEEALASARYMQDRTIAAKLLERMIFLWQDYSIVQDQHLLHEASELVTELHILLADRHSSKAGSGTPFVYSDPVSGAYDASVSVRKWCRYESRLLRQTMQEQEASYIQVPAGAPPFLLLSAIKVCAELGLALDNQNKNIASVGWVSEREIRRLLAVIC